MKVATPRLLCEVNFLKSLEEVARVVRHEIAIMVHVEGVLVGTMGIIRPSWWYGDGVFFTDRWHFVAPEYDGTAAAQSLLDEAEAIARGAGIDFLHQGRLRERRPGIYFMWPRVTRGQGE